REDMRAEKRLIAYITAAETSAPSVEDLTSHVRAHLPEHMVPATFLVLEVLPLTANGKVDRNALPAPPPEAIAEEDQGVRRPVEQAVARVWAEVLQVPGVGLPSSFFDLGGHSLLAIRVAARLREVFDVDVPVRAVFEASSVAAMAAWIELAQEDGRPPAADPI